MLLNGMWHKLIPRLIVNERRDEHFRSEHGRDAQRAVVSEANSPRRNANG